MTAKNGASQKETWGDKGRPAGRVGVGRVEDDGELHMVLEKVVVVVGRALTVEGSGELGESPPACRAGLQHGTTCYGRYMLRAGLAGSRQAGWQKRRRKKKRATGPSPDVSQCMKSPGQGLSNPRAGQYPPTLRFMFSPGRHVTSFLPS